MTVMNVFLINCFATNQKGSGNPATVVTNFSGTDFDRLSFAKKSGSPVTVFISNVDANEPVLNFFYPEAKMPLCLHGALAAASILLEQRNSEHLIFLTEAGKKLHIKKSGERRLQVHVSLQSIEEHKINESAVLKMLNLNNTDHINSHFPFCVASIGSPKLLVPLNSLKCISELNPNYKLIKNWSVENNINGLYVYTTETTIDSADFHARGFNPKTGIG